MGKTGRKNRRYSTEFKLSVILDMLQNNLGYGETVRKYWDAKNCIETDRHRSQLRLWKRQYLEEGYEGLMKNNRKGPRTKKEAKPPRLDKKVEEDLIAENQRLKMEIEYLKKLSALVLADERENGKRRR